LNELLSNFGPGRKHPNVNTMDIFHL